MSNKTLNEINEFVQLHSAEVVHLLGKMAESELLERAKLISKCIKMFAPESADGISLNVWFALNNGILRDDTHLLSACKHKPKRKRLNLPWIIPNKHKIQLSYKTIQGRKPTSMEYSYGYLFGYIAHVVYPYWCYHVEHYGPGTIVIEPKNIQSLETVINTNTCELQKQPNKLFVTYLNLKQFKIFLKTMEFIKNDHMGLKYETNINHTLKAYKERKNPKGAGMSIFYLIFNDTFTMFGWESKYNKSYSKECKNFENAMKKAKIRKCCMLELDLKNKQVSCVKIKIKHCSWIWCKDLKNKQFKICSRCKLARYCCRSHQKRHWNSDHRFYCQK
eukprot:369477_1